MLSPEPLGLAVLVALFSFQSACGSSTPANGGDASSGGSSGSGSDASSGTGSGTSSGSGAPDAAMSSNLAKMCMADGDCGGGLTCLKATDTILANGGPAHGYCSLACTGDSTCAPYGGLCAGVASDAGASQGQCFLSCMYRTLDLNKCRARNDLGCSSAGICVPVCGQDSDCPAARKCDFATGVCADALSPGGQLGTYCMNSSMCAGTCITVNGSAGGTGHVCSTPCVLGRSDGCNFTAGALDAGSGVHGTCRFSPSLAAPGDIGHCAVECATTADCLDTTDPGAYCRMAAGGGGFCSWSASDAGQDAAPVVQDASQDAAGTD